MLNAKKLFSFFLSLFLTNPCRAAIAAYKDYGDFKLKITDYSIKFAEKAKTVMELDFKVNESTDKFSVTFLFHIKKPLGVIGFKIRSYFWNESLKKFTLSFNKIVKSVCENQLSKQLLTMVAGLEDDCHVNVGKYNFSITDMDGFLHAIANGKFFYGRFMGLTDVFAKGFGRLATSNITAVVEPIEYS